MSHFMSSDCDGALYDTRLPDWSHLPPLRTPFHRHHRVITNTAKHHSTIETVADLKATLRAGRFTSLGSYPLFFITADNGVLSFQSVRENLALVLHAIHHGGDDQWRVVRTEENYEDSALYCDHSNAPIPSAYGDAP